MNIILDTNAFTFFYKTYCEIDVPNKWNERKFDNQEYLRCLANCDKILITSETLYELFLQSLRKDGTLKLFLEQYVLMNEINKGRFTLFKELGNGEKGKLVIFNDKNTMYFDSVYLAECVNYRKTLDISRFLSVKIEGEIKYIKRFMDTLLGSVVNVLHEINGDKVIVERYKKVLDKCYAYEETILRKLYDECYIKRKIDNNQFENELDKMLKDVFQLVYEEINGQAFFTR